VPANLDYHAVTAMPVCETVDPRLIYSLVITG
jgi:hypothetical protein